MRIASAITSTSATTTLAIDIAVDIIVDIIRVSDIAFVVGCILFWLSRHHGHHICSTHTNVVAIDMAVAFVLAIAIAMVVVFVIGKLPVRSNVCFSKYGFGLPIDRSHNRWWSE